MTGSFDLVVSGVGTVRPEGFDYRTELGPRGYKYLPPASQYLLAAARRAVADAGDSLASVAEESRAAVVGTNSAASSLHAVMDRTVIETSAQDLSPATAPFFSINLFGSRLATEHALKGFNLTITSPRVAALEALQIGGRCVALGRASWLLVGATEAALDGAEPGARTSETGAVALVLESVDAVAVRGNQPWGRCRVRTAFLPPAAASRDRAAELVYAAFAIFGATHPVRAVLDGSPVAEALAMAIADATGTEVDRGKAGAGCLEPLTQVAEALTAPSVRLVITAAAEGNVAFALVTPVGELTRRDLCGHR
jgi:3-oxoacyl-[acyl-carrier-protein] synthase II